MTRPRVLDLFCGEGGSAYGWWLAGFDPVGVDAVEQPNYPFEFHKGDATTWPLDGFALVTGSPPCKEHTELFRTLPAASAAKHDTGWMLNHTIERFKAWQAATGVPWVVENVPGADVPGSLILCGKEFGLETDQYALKRHRQFLSNVYLMGAGGCDGMHGPGEKPIAGVYGDLANSTRPSRASGRGAARPRASVSLARELMGMPWASAKGLSQAIPPAYTQFIGEQIMAHLRLTVTPSTV